MSKDGEMSEVIACDVLDVHLAKQTGTKLNREIATDLRMPNPQDGDRLSKGVRADTSLRNALRRPCCTHVPASQG